MRTPSSVAVAVVLVLTSFATACAGTAAPPDKKSREDAFSRLHTAVQLGRDANVLEILADTVDGYWDSAIVAGADAYVREWKRVVQGAGITQYRRTIVAERRMNEKTVRDSGRVYLRLRSSDSSAATRDTVLGFVSYWSHERRLKDWRLAVDSLFGVPQP